MVSKLCRLCGKNSFEDGFGVRRRVEGVWDQVCNPCAERSVQREVEQTVAYIEGLKRENPDLDLRALLDKAYRSQRRFNAWHRNYYDVDSSVDKAGYLRVCDEDSTFIPRDAKRLLINARLAQAEVVIEKVGRVEIPIDTTNPQTIRNLQERQKRLDTMRVRILRAIELIKENLEKLDTKGLLRGPAWWNVLSDTTAAAVQLHFRVQNYAEGKDRVDQHLMEQHARQAAAAVGVEAQEAAEEHQVAVAPDGERPEGNGQEGPISVEVEGESGQPTKAPEGVSGAAGMEADGEPSSESKGSEESEGSAVATPPAAKPKPKKKAAKKPEGAARNNSRTSFRLNGAGADDRREITRALKASVRTSGRGSRSQREKTAITVAMDLED